VSIKCAGWSIASAGLNVFEGGNSVPDPILPATEASS
jgi:hypothetical protein